MKHVSLVALAAVVSLTSLTMLGCGSSDPIDRFVSRGPRVQELCRCPEAFGHTDEATCRAEIGEAFAVSEEAERCLRDVYEANTRALDAPLDCALDAIDAQLACAERALRVCPPSMDELRVCGEQLEADTDACPEPPNEVAAQLEACLAR